MRRIDNAGGTVWTYIVGDSHTNAAKTSYSTGYSIAQVRQTAFTYEIHFGVYSLVISCMWVVGFGRSRAML